MRVWFAPSRSECRTGRSVTHEKNSHIAHDFAGRSHLHDVAKGHVHLGVGPGNLRPFVPQAHRLRLFFEVCILAARHFVQIHFGGAGLWTAVKGEIIVAHNFPIVGAFIESLEIDSRNRGRCSPRRRPVELRLG